MKMTIGMAFLCAGVLLAQDAGEKTTVPLKDPSRPAVINAHLIAGGMTVRGADVKDVSVEAHSCLGMQASRWRKTITSSASGRLT
jgi:hypothetical protein